MARLPTDATLPVDVVVNGLPQTEGVDYFIVGRLIVFDRALLAGPPPSRPRRILAACLGIHVGGDTLDVHYRTGGTLRAATGLDIARC
ncbi:hypothetical protein [Paraconexibacter sp. AEG42_29]|uniref:hypothetical protein n=1 Tax=Paraconexibacter sp. AEG42_29 TaxID=2997339 RepID=UPI00339D968B